LQLYYFFKHKLRRQHIGEIREEARRCLTPASPLSSYRTKRLAFMAAVHIRDYICNTNTAKIGLQIIIDIVIQIIINFDE